MPIADGTRRCSCLSERSGTITSVTSKDPVLPSMFTGAERDELAQWMSRAVAQEKSCVDESGRDRPAPKVGVVVVDRHGSLLGESYRGAHDPGDHAEYGLLEKQLADVDLTGAAVFTTLEPCTKRGKGKTPCAQRLIDRGVAAVYIGMYDPFPPIYRKGWDQLTGAGIGVYDFYPQYRREVEFDNREFTGALALSVGDHGQASFDYKQNSGDFTVVAGGTTFVTHWTQRDADSIYAYNYKCDGIALARSASSFAEIDDPRALHWDNHAESPHIGEIIVFKSKDNYLLVKITDVIAGPERGRDHYQLDIEYELRRLTAYP